jgi:hypothetical protein
MKRQHWLEDKWDIVTMGFLVELDPGRLMMNKVCHPSWNLRK